MEEEIRILWHCRNKAYTVSKIAIDDRKNLAGSDLSLASCFQYIQLGRPQEKAQISTVLPPNSSWQDYSEHGGFI